MHAQVFGMSGQAALGGRQAGVWVFGVGYGGPLVGDARGSGMNGATRLFPRTVCAVAEILTAHRFPDWAPVTVAGARAVVNYRFSGREHERRAAVGLGAMTSPDVLRLLVSLPLGERVRSGALTPADRRRLRWRWGLRWWPPGRGVKVWRRRGGSRRFVRGRWC